MKYSKIIKENFQNSFSYIFTILFSCSLFILLCVGFTNIKYITAYFSGGADINDSNYRVTYYSNMPEGVFSAVKFKIYSAQSNYEILDNMFGVPDGYEFIGWNTSSDGTGNCYQESNVIFIETDYSLYAQWKDLSLIEPPLDDEITDDNIDDDSLDDSDEDNDSNIDEENGDDEEEGNPLDDNNSSNSNEGSGNGTGGLGSGTSGSSNNSSSGTVNNNNTSNNISGNNSNSNNNSSSGENNNSNKDNSTSNNEDNEILKGFVFKFYNNNILYSTTTCNVINGSCMLVLPTVNPEMDNSIFVGWSTNHICSDNIITDTIKVNSDMIYYACYENNSDNNYVYIIGVIWIIAGISIYFVVSRYKKNYDNIEN